MKGQTYQTTKGFIRDAKLPEETRTYKPILHDDLINLTLDCIRNAGFNVSNEDYTATSDGQIATGRYVISNLRDSEMKLQVAWQNSYNKMKKAAFAIGARITVCDNGMVYGDMGSFKKKHQGDAQSFVPSTIVEYIRQAGEMFKKMQEEREIMKSVILNQRNQAELVGRMLLTVGFISPTQVSQIANQMKEYRTCRKENKPVEYDYGTPDSLWELYNFTTYTMKDIHPFSWMADQIAAHKFFTTHMTEMSHKTVVPVEIVLPEHSDISPNQLQMEFQN